MAGCRYLIWSDYTVTLEYAYKNCYSRCSVCDPPIYSCPADPKFSYETSSVSEPESNPRDFEDSESVPSVNSSFYDDFSITSLDLSDIPRFEEIDDYSQEMITSNYISLNQRMSSEESTPNDGVYIIWFIVISVLIVVFLVFDYWYTSPSRIINKEQSAVIDIDNSSSISIKRVKSRNYILKK